MSETTELSGSALAEAVAIKVMGWTFKNGLWLFSVEPRARPTWFDGKERQYIYAADFRPDLNIAQAWEVVESMANRESDYQCRMQRTFTSFNKCQFRRGGEVWEHECESMPEAICLAALDAIEAAP